MAKLAYCDACNAVTESTALVQIGESDFCARCKGKEMQSLREQGRSLVRPMDYRLPRGPYGWLLIFAIYYAVVRPLFFAILLLGKGKMELFMDDFPSTLALQFLSFIAVTIAGLVAGIIVWSGHRRGKFVAVRYLYISILWMLVMQAIDLWRLTDARDLAHELANVHPLLLLELTGPTIWIGYFKFSKRVRNTYGER